MIHDIGKSVVLALAAALILCRADLAHPQCPPDVPQATIHNPEPEANDEFGTAVAVSDDRLVVGEPSDNPGGLSNAGTARVFDAMTGTLVVTLNAPSPGGGDLFGGSVAIRGGRVAIGARFADPGGVSDAGRAYVFDAVTGALITNLDHPSPGASDLFGAAVAISDDLVVAGAIGDDPGGVINAGSAFVFDAATGAQVSVLNHPSPALLDGFGVAVAISGNLVAVGAPGRDAGGMADSGAAWVFDATTGALISTLDNPAPGLVDNFGAVVAISGGIVLVGEPLGDPGGVSDAGGAYVFNAMTGALIASLDNPDPAAGDQFGFSAALSGGFAIVGARYDDPGGVSDAGLVRIFDPMTGALLSTVQNPAPGTGDSFGYSAGAAGNIAVIGAFRDDPGGVISAGSVYTFSCVPPTATPTSAASATPTATPSASASPAPSSTPTATPSPSPSATATASASPSPTAETPCVPAMPDLTFNKPAAVPGIFFGYSVALSGDLMIVGAYRTDPGGVAMTGSAWVYDVSTGALVSTLSNPAPEPGDHFGWSVAIEGDVAVVGAARDHPGGIADAGTAYVFDATTGALTATFNNPAPGVADNFGYSVAISGNLAVVGAFGDNPNGSLPVSGSAYVHNVTTGAHVATLNNPAPEVNDQFGGKVAISGNLAIVAASADKPGGVQYAGTVYVFNATTGALLRVLNNPAPAENDFFGTSLAVSGDLVVIGAQGDSPGGVAGAGSAYLFNAATGAHVMTYDNPVPEMSDVFGSAVGISGDLVLVGAARDSPGGVLFSGTAYLFEALTGALVATIDNPGPDAGDWFGYAVALSGDVAVVTSLYDDPPGGVSNEGTVYRFSCIVPTETPTASPTSTPTPSPTATPTASPAPCCPGDADNSGSFVDANDFIAVQANFGADNGPGGLGDANCSGSFVDANDFIAVQANFGADCG